MSVIFGIKEGNNIIIAGDKRGSTKNGMLLTDNLNKVIVINKHLAFASAGNAAIEKAIQMDVDKITDKEIMTTDDLLDIIKDFYLRVNGNRIAGILALPFYFLIAGKNQENETSLVSGGNSNGKLDAKEVPMALYPPADTDMNVCCTLFSKNYKLHHSEFVERTIREISDMSQLVSTEGDKWIFNAMTGKGSFHSF